jgi:MarR family transcriptional regulator for hemolysin
MPSDPTSSDWQPRKEVSFWLATASRLLNKSQDHALRAIEFSSSQIPVLTALAAHEPRSQKELADFARIEQPSMTELLARMERAGLITRQPHPQDGRSVMISRASRAREEWPRAAQALETAEARLLHGLDATETATLKALLQQLVWNMGQNDGS